MSKKILNSAHIICRRQVSGVLLVFGLAVLFLNVDAINLYADGNLGGYDAVMLEEQTTYKISSSGKAEMTVRCRVKVLNSGGKSHGLVYLWESEFIKLKEFKGRVYDSDDQLIYSVGKKDGERICGYSGYSLYSDDCLRMYQLSSSKYPFIAEYEYKIEYKSAFFWPDWRPQREIPVHVSKYELSVPQGFEFRTKEIGSVASASISEHKRKMIYSYEMTEIPAYEPEDYTLPNDEQMISLKFSPKSFKLGKYDFDGDSWSSLSIGLHEMMEKSFILSDAQKALIEKIYATANSQRQICEMLHQALTETMRYVAIQIGIGSWQPTSSQETFERGYGDCKDLATMYVSMLRHVGIEAYTTLILTKKQGVTYADFPSINRFNHVILFSIADGDTLWIDPTYQQCVVGDLPSSDEDTFVLKIDSAGGQIIRTPLSSPEDNIVKRKVHIDINPDKSASVNLCYEAFGNIYHQIKGFLNSTTEDELDQLLSWGVFGLTQKFKADSLTLNSSPDSANIEINIDGKVRQALYSIGEKRYLDLRFLTLLRNRELTDLSDRSQALDLGYPQSHIDTVIIAMPIGWQLLDLPTDSTISDQFGTLKVDYSEQNDDRLLIAREYKSYHNLIHVNDMSEYERHINRVIDAVDCRIVMVKP